LSAAPHYSSQQPLDNTRTAPITHLTLPTNGDGWLRKTESKLPEPPPMAPLASPPLPYRAPAFLAAPAIRSGRPPRLLSPSRSASPLLSSGCAGCFPRAPRAPCTAARERRRDAVRVRLPITVSSSMQCPAAALVICAAAIAPIECVQ